MSVYALRPLVAFADRSIYRFIALATVCMSRIIEDSGIMAGHVRIGVSQHLGHIVERRNIIVII